MSETMTLEQQAFEKWVASNTNWSLDRNTDNPNGDWGPYTHERTTCAWLGWKAAISSAAEPVAWANAIEVAAPNDGFVAHRERVTEFFTVPVYLHPSADARDAARYRWLRDVAGSYGDDGLVDRLADAECSSDFDAVIDAAMGKEGAE